jgi:outer membrane protein OmpA-like peptidoglycan-associated protein
MPSPKSGLVAVLSVAAILVAPVMAAAIANHPAVSPYPGSVATSRKNVGHTEYALVVGVDAAAKSDAEALKALTVAGDLTRIAYENPKGKSGGEIFANYVEGLAAGGFEILFQCEAATCGPSYGSSRWGRITGLRYFTSEMRYVAAKHPGGGKEIYVAILVSPLRHEIDVLEAAEMERGLVTAKGLSDGMLLNGRAVLDGVFFDTDKTTLKPESKPALDVVAKFLKDNPALDVYIVGHTDRVGSLEHNMALSRGRAAAVVAALTAEYGVAASRLSAHGVGPLAPDKSNAAEAGRAANRRVEMVER